MVTKKKKSNLDKLREALESTGLVFGDSKEDWKKVQWCMNRIVDLACAIIKEVPEGCRPARSVYAVLWFVVKFIQIAIRHFHDRDREPLFKRLSQRHTTYEQSQMADDQDVQTIGSIIKELKIFKK